LLSLPPPPLSNDKNATYQKVSVALGVACLVILIALAAAIKFNATTLLVLPWVPKPPNEPGVWFAIIVFFVLALLCGYATYHYNKKYENLKSRL